MTSSVNRREGSADRVLFLRGVAIEDMLVGHLEFALCHEGVNLEAIDALFEHLPPQDLLAWLNEAPNGAHIRRVCHLWEWLTGQELPAEVFRREARSSCFLPTITSPSGGPPTTASSADVSLALPARRVLVLPRAASFRYTPRHACSTDACEATCPRPPCDPRSVRGSFPQAAGTLAPRNPHGICNRQRAVRSPAYRP